MPSAIRRDDDDAIVTFKIAGVWTASEWSHIGLVTQYD